MAAGTGFKHVGYLVNARIGAITYNFIHHKGLAIAIYLAGSFFEIPELTLAGIVLFAHSSMDRVFGYGLKYADDFKHTHLGWIGTSPPKVDAHNFT